MATTTFPKTQADAVTPAAKLKPKEHGAYAILGIPIATSLLIAGISVPGVCVAIASVTGFLAHEPLLVAWGHRGARAQRSTPAATRRLVILTGFTILCGCVALLAGSNPVRISLLGCLGLASTSFVLAVAGNHRSLLNQLWGIVGLSVPCVPILLAGAIPTDLAIEIWTTWLIGFAATTMAVRGVIAAQKRHPRTIHGLAISALSVLVLGRYTWSSSLVIVTLPMLAMSGLLMIWPPPAKHLKRVGWTLVVGTVVTAVWMIAVV
ncbi:YwiC-like family protein [Stieleria sp. ICT_E10.1]|uniref:YwiC-like family protein n=1 Tax=Stieleria sedimenti TaxID=2976331 RepID=UPI00217F7996|nr:YwiC-like family protein [Stieleria sedimenti]MCS7465402.1 YwiC-like family protein [Stieleria sedimenti]